jgi:hypothetical protein
VNKKYAVCVERHSYEQISSTGIAVVMRETYKVSTTEHFVGPFSKEKAEEIANNGRENAKEHDRFSPLPKFGRIYVLEATPEISEKLISPSA